jgi:hypothetical protein
MRAAAIGVAVWAILLGAGGPAAGSSPSPGPPPASSPGVEREDQSAPGLWVGLHVPSSAIQAGFAGSLPVEVGAYHVEDAAGVPGFLAAALQGSFTWEFSGGRGELFARGSPFPCRLFRVVLPPVQKPFLTTIVRGAAGPTMRDTSPGSLWSVLKGPLAVAVVGLKSTNLAAIFPVPLALSPPSIGEHVTLLALAAASSTISATSSWKIEGAGPALVSGLVQLGVVGSPSADAAVKTLVSSLAPYKTQDPGAAQPYVMGTLGKSPYSAGIASALKTFVATAPADVTKPALFLGKIAASAPLDLSTLVGTDPESAAIAVGLFPCVGEHRISRVDGYALPLVSSKKKRPYVQAYVSPLSASNFFTAKAAILRHLLRAWRWRIILDPASYAASGNDHALAQTLLRMNEPIWDYITAMTVQTAVGPGLNPIGPQTKLDPVDARELDDRIGLAAARAASAHAAVKVYSMEPAGHSTSPASRNLWGSQNDALYPCSGLLPDHLVDSAIFTAMKTTDRLKLARQLVKLVSSGFTRPASPDVLTGAPDELIPDEWKKPLEGVDTIEPDLTWLGRAVQALAAGEHPLARPFAILAPTRTASVLTALPGSLTSATWAGSRDEEHLYFFLVASDADLRKLSAVMQYALGPLAKAASQWDAVVREQGKAVDPPYNDAWWKRFKSDPTSFASLPAACDTRARKASAATTGTAATTAPQRCQDWAMLSRTYLRQQAIIADVTANVSTTIGALNRAQQFPVLMAWRVTPVSTNFLTDGAALVTETTTAALSSLANDADPAVKAGAALSAACAQAYDANATLIRTFRCEDTMRAAEVKPLVNARFGGSPLKLPSLDFVRQKLTREILIPAADIEEKIWEWALIGPDPGGKYLARKNPPTARIVAKVRSLLRAVAAARRQTVTFGNP